MIHIFCIIDAKSRVFYNRAGLDKNKQYLLPLEKEELSLQIIYNNVFSEDIKNAKSLLGLGCIKGDERSGCGCLFW